MNRQKVVSAFSKEYGSQYSLYPNSLKHWKNNFFFMVKDEKNKYLAVIGGFSPSRKFEGESSSEIEINGDKRAVRIAYLTHHNLLILRKMFPFLSPSNCGKRASFGSGDRLGIITPAHIQAYKDRDIFPILAQQSVREMTRTERNWESVIDEVIWGCFEAGYGGPFGADADHVKEIKDIQGAIDVGYTMFTIDPSDQVNDNVPNLTKRELEKLYNKIPERKKLEKLYLGKTYTVSGHKLQFTQEDLAIAMLTYYQALKHVIKCYQYLKEHSQGEFDLEVSVDETLASTSPISHIFIVEELHRNGVDFQNLALHYIGVFQKAIDYIGEVEKFTREMEIHAAIAKKFGGYKLSLHSGGLKFSVFPAFSEKTQGLFHVKISTTYLESVRIIIRKNPDLYRQMHPYILEKFNQDKASYDLTTDLSLIPDINKIPDSHLEDLLDKDESRQVIHTTYGSVLSDKNKKGTYLFRNQIYQTLYQNEDEHYQFVSEHVKKHLDLLKVS
jgi:hypothetical protein